MTKLFVYGVDQNLANVDIQAEFEKFGMVTDVYNSGSVFNTFAFLDLFFQMLNKF
jgi:hypothetical protein